MTTAIRARISAAHPGPRGGWRTPDGRVKIGDKFRARVVWDETHPDDPLRPGEVIHHANGIKDDDRPENLVKLPSQAAHASLHFKGVPKSPEHVAKQAAAQSHPRTRKH